MLTKLLRLEDAANRGPFNSYIIINWNILYHSGFTADTHPVICYDVYDWDRNHVCACEGIEQLSHWFPPDVVVYLLSKGFKLIEYTVPDAAVKKGRSGVQVCFRPEDAVSRVVLAEAM